MNHIIIGDGNGIFKGSISENNDINIDFYEMKYNTTDKNIKIVNDEMIKLVKPYSRLVILNNKNFDKNFNTFIRYLRKMYKDIKEGV